MKRFLLRATLLLLSLLLLLQTGAFSAFGATDEEIEQYEQELAAYLEWKAYREQETAYYAYQTALQNYASQNEGYLQYQNTIQQIERKLSCLDYIFIQDERGWALIESIELGVGAVETFTEDPENMEKYEDLIGQLTDVLKEAKASSDALKEIFTGYRNIVDSSYSSEHARTKARYDFYQAHYASLMSNAFKLRTDLYSFYAKSNIIIREAIINKENEKNMEGRYLKLVFQLTILFYCLDDTKNLPRPNDRYAFEGGQSLNQIFGAGSPQIIQDTNDANPAGVSFPSTAVSTPVLPEPVEKPTKPTSTEITVEPTPPAGYDPNAHRHTWSLQSTTQATCTVAGAKVYLCADCGETKTETIAPLGHNYVTTVTEATCTEKGFTVHTCLRCNDSYTDAQTDALGHAWNSGVVTKEATCTTPGIKTYTCSRCNTTRTEAISALGHNYQDVVTKPTCTAQGYTTHTCSRCGFSQVDTYTDALGHDWSNWVENPKPGCTTAGAKSRTCNRCGLKENESLTALGHNYSAVVTNPTCTAQGYTTHTCSRCGDSYIDTYTQMIAHSWNAGVVTKSPTCTEKGSKTYTCTRCNTTRTEEIAAVGHKSVVDPAVAATCTATGLTAGTHCSVCGVVLTAQQTTAALGHNWNSGTVTKAPTCTEKGVKTYTCSRCKSTYTEDIDATGHKSVTDPAVAATCTVAGLTAGAHCSVCKAVLIAQTTVPALGHSWNSGVVTKQPTDVASGKMTFTCTRCGTTDVQEIPALGHAYADVVTPPTCTEQGYTTHTCTHAGCGESYVDSYVQALGHNWNDGAVTKAATCTATGVKTFTCKRCSTTRTETIEALGHDYRATVTSPTCTEQGYTTHTCSRCNDQYQDTYTNALGHQWASWTVKTQPGCTTAGEEKRTCSRCSANEARPIVALDHDYKAAKTDATCTLQGYTTHTCTRCGDSYQDTYTDALGHAWNAGSVTTSPTCTTPGVKTFTCTRCKDTQTEGIAALGHDYKDVVTSPTCTERGYTTHTCNRCNEVHTDTYVDALGHNWDAGLTTTEPDCTTPGVKTYTCLRCNETKTESLPALGHQYSTAVTPASCEAGGYTTHTCTRCDDSYVDGQTDPLGHSWNDGVVTKAPTEIFPGVKTFTCSRCKATRTEEIPTLDEETPDDRPVKQLGSDSAGQQDLKNSVKENYVNGISKGDVKAEISVAAAEYMLESGVQSVSLQVILNDTGDRIFFTVKNGTPNPSARLFRLQLDEGENEDYRYIYFRRKKTTALSALPEGSTVVSLSTDPTLPVIVLDPNGVQIVLDQGETLEALPYGKVSLSLSDEVLRLRSYYIRPSEEIDDENVYLAALPTSAMPGDTVIIDPPCDYGYELKGLVVTDSEGNRIEVTGNSFVMPERPVTVFFTVEKIIYRVKYYFDGELIAEQEYGAGEEIIPPAEDTLPEKESDEDYHYTFIGWSLELKTAIGDERELIAEARFAKTDAKYKDEVYDLRWAFLKPVLIIGGGFLLFAGGIVFLIVFLKKKKKKQAAEVAQSSAEQENSEEK